MNPRIEKLYLALEKENLDAIILSNPSNITYLAGFKSRDSYAIISKTGNYYITDSRYVEEIKKQLKGFSLLKINKSVFKLIADTCNTSKLVRIGFEGRNLAFAEFNKIKESLQRSADLIPIHSLVEEIRKIKSEEEIEKIEKATQIAIKALNFIKDFVKPGRKEIEVAAELERFIRYNGANSSSFDIIVASGPNSCFPHHLTSVRKIKKDEPVLIDMGVDYSGYKSDLTRVFFSGKISVSVKKIYSIVLEAQKLAIDNIKPGVNIKQIDTASRNYIEKQGFGGFFGHNTGHGIGLDVHEEPHISYKADEKLAKGMVFTVEPGIYLPGKFGIRIEDMVLVTQKGVKVISGSLNK